MRRIVDLFVVWVRVDRGRVLDFGGFRGGIYVIGYWSDFCRRWR